MQWYWFHTAPAPCGCLACTQWLFQLLSLQSRLYTSSYGPAALLAAWMLKQFIGHERLIIYVSRLLTTGRHRIHLLTSCTMPSGPKARVLWMVGAIGINTRNGLFWRTCSISTRCPNLSRC